MRKTPGESTGDRTKYWTRIIREARHHAAGVKGYCRDNDISVDSYYGWFKRLKPEHPEWQDQLTHPSRNARQPQTRELPETEVIEHARRRRFTAVYKARILREADAAVPGNVAALLRREGLYTSHLQKWRLERDKRSLKPRKRGPKVNPQASELKKLKADYARLEKKLRDAHILLDLQKKVAEILKTTMLDED